MVKPNRLILPEPPTPQRSPLRFFVWLGLLVVVIASTTFIQFNEEGEPELSLDRLAKLVKELDELDNAEQYALLAARDGSYPCYSCTGKSTIFMRQGEVWKYGVTRKGERGRYGEWHVDMGLFYVIQYEGPLQECLKREKLMIYHYAVSPENLARDTPLIRPPGNKQDN